MGQLYLELALFIGSFVMFLLTLAFRKPGAKMFGSLRNLGQTYRTPGAVLYVAAMISLFLGIFLQLSRRL